MELKEVVKLLKEYNKGLDDGRKIVVFGDGTIGLKSRFLTKSFANEQELIKYLKPQVKINTTRDNLIKALSFIDGGSEYSQKEIEDDVDDMIDYLKKLEQENK